MRIKNYRKRSIGTLVVLLFVLSFSITPALLFSNYNFGSGFENPTDEEQNLNLSTNYLFQGTTYTFNLDDFYDDTDLYKIYTGAKFQTEAFNGTSLEWSGVINNDTIIPVDNDETELGDPNNINMVKGTTDSADNMKINDDSYTTFTSTHTDGYIYETPSQWDDFIFTNGTGYTIGELETIDANSSVIQDDYFGIDDYFTIIPDGDSAPLMWVSVPQGAHWEKIDEDPDANDEGTTMILDVMGGALTDVINYASGDIQGGSVYKIVVRYAYAGSGDAGDANIDINLGGWLGPKTVIRPEIGFTPQDLEWTGLSGDQTDVDNLQVRLISHVSTSAVNYFTAVWVKVYYLKLEIDLDVQVDMQVDNIDCSSIEYFKYSHKTNISATMDLDIWNWDTTTWFEIESVDNFASFDDDSFTLGLGSDYVNSSFGVRIRFQLNTGSDDFELQIDRFRLDYLTTPAELEMTITFPFANYNEDLLVMTLQSWQKTNISQTITFKIWNYDTETWVQISSSSETTFTKKEYNTISPTNFFSPTGIVKLNWTGSDTFDDFELHIDYLFIQIYYKLDLVHKKSFDTNGIYRYRWCVLGSIQYTQWVVFEIVDPVPNFHAISESDNPTRWLLQGADISPVENFTDDISGANWDLSGVSNRFFIKSTSQKIDYLLDNSSLVHSWSYTGTSYDISSQDTFPYSIFYYNGYWYLSGETNTDIYKYTSSWTYTSTSYDIGSQDISPASIRFYNGYWWMYGRSNEKIYKYNPDWTYTSTSYDISSEEPNPMSFDYYDGNWYVVGFTNDRVYKYDSSWTYTETSYDISSQVPIPVEIRYYDGYFWIVDEYNDRVYKYTTDFTYTGIYYSISQNNSPMGIDFYDGYWWMVGQYGTNDKVYKYYNNYDISKNYQGGGYMYMQTNTTETIALKSTAYGTNYTLSSGDYFEVDFQTSSDSQINIDLLKDGVINKTLVLSQSGNPNFNRHTVQILVDETVEFDQLRFSSTFEDTDYVRIYDIKTHKYTLTGDSADFYVGSKNDRELYLTPDFYNLKISDPYDGEVKVNTNITISSGYNSYLYEPMKYIQCRLTLFSLAQEYLQFEDYHVNVSRSLGGEYDDFWLVDTLFYADIDSYVYIEVYDRFDALIYSEYDDIIVSKSYIDLYIEIYSLKIRNEATEIVEYELENTDTGSSKSGILFSDEIVEYRVKSDNYSLDYTNHEDDYPREYNFELTTHKTISINSTYHTVYFGLFTYDGLGLNRDWVRFYISDDGNVTYVRKDFGRNIIQSETAHLIVLDYFNNTLANETIDASAYSEYNIYVQVYSLYLLNQFTYDDLIMNITQEGSGTWMNQLIPASSALRYRFIPNVNYTINCTYVNGTIYSIRTINLTDNSQTESFGIPSKPSEYPKNVYFGVYTTIGLGIDHDLLRFYIDGNRSDFGFNRIEDMIVLLTVKDYFNTILFNQNINTSGIYEYNILITLYSLQIKNLQIQETTVDINSTLYEGTLLSEESLYFMLAKDYYEIGYYDTNDVYKQFIIYLDSNQAYELNRSQICILIYADQQGNHLVFENYKTYLNGSRTYINNFYREIGDIVGIEIKDRYDISIKNDTLTVVSGVNEKYIVLTIYSLKVMSQQLCFNHINITRDPVHYISSMYWSEWIAPSEIINFRLFPGYYVINVTNYEDGGWSEYDYTFNGDDVLLIGSNNTLYNVLVNIANVNATIGNQITNVLIDITNQNSNINNTIINIEINLGNINSTLGTLLLDIDTAISNINSSIITEIVSLGTTINNINSSITNEILNIGVDIININNSIISQLLTLGVDISNINGSIVNQIIDLGVNVSNIGTSLSNQILSIGVDISNLDTSITDQIVLVISNITNINTTLSTQITSLSSDITNVNSTIVNQIIDLGVDITNINTSLSNQILSLEVDISNLDTSITEQVLLVIAEIENIETVIDDQTLAILSDITNVNSTLLNQMVVLGVDITNINVSITNQILDLSVDLTNINSSISNLLTNIEISISNLENDIGTFYAFTNTSFINLNNVMNTSFINIENNIYSINQTISNLVIGVSNDIYLLNGTISTMITQLETNLLLMNVSIDTALFDLGTTLNLIGSNITSNYILLNNSIYLNNLNINDSRIAIINNLLLVNNTISTLIADVYSAVYLINNSIYTAVVDLGTYLNIINNTISGDLSIVLEMNDFLTELYVRTMFSELLNWTDIGFNITLLISQTDMWTFVNNYRNQSIEVHLRYQGLIEKLVISADDSKDQWLPSEDVWYNLWSVADEEYLDEWEELDPDDKTVSFGFFETDVPEIPEPLEWDILTFAAFIVIISVFFGIVVILYANWKIKAKEVPEETRLKHKRNRTTAPAGTYDHR